MVKILAKTDLDKSKRFIVKVPYTFQITAIDFQITVSYLLKHQLMK
ncbi:hypothetical protein [Dendronalium phyllosphericum]